MRLQSLRKLFTFSTPMIAIALACGSSSPTANPDSGLPTGNGDGGPDAGLEELTVKNFSTWCDVSVNSGLPSTVEEQTVHVAPGSIPLFATPSSSAYILGKWHHTVNDLGSGDPGTVVGTVSRTSVNVGSTPACVWVCCPFSNGTGCPTTDQCP
jgi:hypothetical protein